MYWVKINIIPVMRLYEINGKTSIGAQLSKMPIDSEANFTTRTRQSPKLTSCSQGDLYKFRWAGHIARMGTELISLAVEETTMLKLRIEVVLVRLGPILTTQDLGDLCKVVMKLFWLLTFFWRSTLPWPYKLSWSFTFSWRLTFSWFFTFFWCFMLSWHFTLAWRFTLSRRYTLYWHCPGIHCLEFHIALKFTYSWRFPFSWRCCNPPTSRLPLACRSSIWKA